MERKRCRRDTWSASVPSPITDNTKGESERKRGRPLSINVPHLRPMVGLYRNHEFPGKRIPDLTPL